MTFSGSFQYLQATTPKNVLTCKFTLNQLQLDFMTKWGKPYYKVRQLWCIYYKLRQVLLQSETAIALQNGAISIIKWGVYYKVGHILQSGATFITKWGRYYKVGQLFESTEGKWDKYWIAKSFGYWFPDSPMIYLVTDNLLLGTPKNLNFCKN